MFTHASRMEGCREGKMLYEMFYMLKPKLKPNGISPITLWKPSTMYEPWKELNQSVSGGLPGADIRAAPHGVGTTRRPTSVRSGSERCRPTRCRSLLHSKVPG